MLLFRWSLCAWLLLAAMPAHAEEPVSAQGSEGASEPVAVVELFTSQGCSSCIAADKYFNELAYRDDVIALSFHVDYWDYLGWEDTFGSPENTERQRDYAEMRGSHRIYTPQMVINGETDVIGSDRPGAEAIIGQSALPVPVRMWSHDGMVEIEVGAHPLPGARPMTVWLVLFASKGKVRIERGENAGTTFNYHNVVRAMRPIGMWDGGVVRVKLPEDELMGKGVDSCAVLLQEDRPDGPGAIVGAAMLRKW